MFNESQLKLSEGCGTITCNPLEVEEADAASTKLDISDRRHSSKGIEGAAGRNLFSCSEVAADKKDASSIYASSMHSI